MTTLSEKLLELIEKVKRPPKNDTERGFQLATLRLCALVRKEIVVHRKDEEHTTYTKEEFISLLDRLADNHEE
jgi:hypothetical protein